MLLSRGQWMNRAVGAWYACCFPRYVVSADIRQWLRWRALEVLGCLFEAALVAMAFWLVWNLKTDRGNKATVACNIGFTLKELREFLRWVSSSRVGPSVLDTRTPILPDPASI